MKIPVACPRCGESNVQGRDRCWVCDGPLAAARQEVRKGLSAILRISLPIAAVLVIGQAAVMGLAVVLFYVTCSGGR